MFSNWTQVLAQSSSSNSSNLIQMVSRRETSFLSAMFRSRTFKTAAGEVYIDRTGSRRGPTSVSQYDRTTGELTVIWVSRPGTYESEQLRQPFWLLGHPPANSPVCGFLGEKCQETDDMTKVFTVAFSTTAILVSCGCSGMCLWMKRKKGSPQAPFFSFLLEDFHL
ncbi:hypothetical protein RvY_16097-2 [Ramazzottius varieornatus]|uniref:Uncharacterized protein n=1 Tax=Ramazzottius varieornatus TaxID=947166 RepID=A0A1D1W516_RAMVA|nr:hypothetical protein RvY_16097-2 [Ramazzottius varieornatus]